MPKYENAAEASASASRRRQQARVASYAQKAKHDPRETTRAATKAFNERWALQVDPNNELPLAERARRVEAARKQYYTALALKSVKARAARKAANKAVNESIADTRQPELKRARDCEFCSSDVDPNRLCPHIIVINDDGVEELWVRIRSLIDEPASPSLARVQIIGGPS